MKKSDKSNVNIHDLGLQADTHMLMQSTMDRRKLLTLGVVGISSLVSCSVFGQQDETETGQCASEIPNETAGPYPANGQGGRSPNASAPNILKQTGVVRQDLRTSIGTGNTAEGIPLTANLKLVNINDSCAPLKGYAIYLWHCTLDGNYSMYNQGIVDEDYLRGVQASDSSGTIKFTTIFPGCYAGRWPHMHFEIYPSLEKATDASNKIKTSQLALPEDICRAAYAEQSYATSLRNLNSLSLESDNVFRDGYADQMSKVQGSITTGYTADLTVGISQ